jgi:hypothetical protein
LQFHIAEERAVAAEAAVQAQRLAGRWQAPPA